MRLRLLVWLLTPLVAVLDQVSKSAVLHRFAEGQQLELIPGYLNLTLTFNKGIAFGMLSQFPDTVRQVTISIATAAALAMVAYFLVRHFRNDAVAQAGLALVVGGAIGNIIDRLSLGQVVDFIDAYYGRYHWPAFNLADSAVCIGVAILLFRPAAKPAVSNESDAAERGGVNGEP